MQAHADTRLFITPTVAGELAAGASLADEQRWREFIAPFRALAITPGACWHYGRTYRFLQENGMLIGANDLWIAAVALAHGVPLVTRNTAHFRRVPELEVIAYA